ncbi:hypothetical protein [Halopelagius longus]|uniref:YccF domain-containing protein n=1 Tax=Halopelagius longus TaxID=1236180 RepID=A0A370IQQ3_9EURY|nr:hypothetical protein [Halopelagius longus]RDI73060.1 YccF domain-containing protein [Halopelagius longus]
MSSDVNDRSLVVRALWFVLVGWWATPLVANLAWALNVTVFLAPVGVKLVNLVPTVLTLKEPRSLTDPDSARGQRSLLVRALYFVFAGWWLGFLWANAASFLAVTVTRLRLVACRSPFGTVVGLPVAVWMLNRLPAVTSLYRFDG